MSEERSSDVHRGIDGVKSIDPYACVSRKFFES